MANGNSPARNGNGAHVAQGGAQDIAQDETQEIAQEESQRLVAGSSNLFGSRPLALDEVIDAIEKYAHLDGITIHVSQVDSNRNAVAIGRYAPASFNYEQLIEQFGGGEYRVRISKSGQVRPLKQFFFLAATPRRSAAPAPAPQPVAGYYPQPAPPPYYYPAPAAAPAQAMDMTALFLGMMNSTNTMMMKLLESQLQPRTAPEVDKFEQIISVAKKLNASRGGSSSDGGSDNAWLGDLAKMVAGHLMKPSAPAAAAAVEAHRTQRLPIVRRLPNNPSAVNHAPGAPIVSADSAQRPELSKPELARGGPQPEVRVPSEVPSPLLPSDTVTNPDPAAAAEAPPQFTDEQNDQLERIAGFARLVLRSVGKRDAEEVALMGEPLLDEMVDELADKPAGLATDQFIMFHPELEPHREFVRQVEDELRKLASEDAGDEDAGDEEEEEKASGVVESAT